MILTTQASCVLACVICGKSISFFTVNEYGFFYPFVCNFTEFASYSLHSYGQISGFLMKILPKPVLGHCA